MNQNQGNSHQESFVNFSTLPTELLVYIISFLSSLSGKVTLRYVSKWLRCVIEGTPSLWKEFVWPYYDSQEECRVNEVLKACGQHIRVLSFPNSRVPSTLVGMLQYCSNVQHLRLPSTKLDPEQLRNIMHHMRCLLTLELKVDVYCDIKQLLLGSGQLKELTVHNFTTINNVFRHWIELQFRPPRLNVIAPKYFISVDHIIDYAIKLTTIPTGTTANFRVYNSHRKVPLNLSPTPPYFQLQFEGSGHSKVTTPYVKLSDFGILGLENDLAVMVNGHYGGRIMHMVRYLNCYGVANKLSYIAKYGELNRTTHFDFSHCQSIHSGHLEQLAIVFPNLQRLNLQYCSHCLENLKGLQAIAIHCQNLQGLNLLGIHVSKVQDQILFWEILSDIKLTHLAVEACALKSKVSNQKMLNGLLQKCQTIRGVQCGYCCCEGLTNDDTLTLSYFPSLKYCYAELFCKLPSIVKDVINNCKELRCVYFYQIYHSLSLGLIRNHNLEQLCIDSEDTDIPDVFLTSISAHGGLVHVVMRVRSLTFDGITSLVRNSPKLITLYLCVSFLDVKEENFNATLKKLFGNRRLFTAGLYNLMDFWRNGSREVLLEQGTDLIPLWD